MYVGKSKRHLQQIRSLDIGISHNWVNIFGAKELADHPDCVNGEISIIRLEIAHNHMSGQNSRIAQVKINKTFAPGGFNDFQKILVTPNETLRQLRKTNNNIKIISLKNSIMFEWSQMLKSML